MSEKTECLKQSYNSRSKRWVLIDCNSKGGIKNMSPEPFPGVPKMNNQPGENEHTNQETQGQENEEREAELQPQDQRAAAETEKADTKGPDNNKNREDSGWFW